MKTDKRHELKRKREKTLLSRLSLVGQENRKEMIRKRIKRREKRIQAASQASRKRRDELQN